MFEPLIVLICKTKSVAQGITSFSYAKDINIILPVLISSALLH